MGVDSPGIRDLMECIGYEFKDLTLLERALTHGSARDRGLSSNQRLEFLGDAVLDLVMSELLYFNEAELGEGLMTQSKARCVSGSNLVSIGERWHLIDHLRVGNMYNSRDEIASSILADAVEAIIAAVHIDGGAEASREFVIRHFRSDLEAAITQPEKGDHKSLLSRWCQRRRAQHPLYRCIDQTGPPHQPVFEVAVILDGVERARAQGSTKKEAEQEAARQVLDGLKEF